MASYTWPGTLPSAVLLDGYEERPPELTIRTQMDAGPAKVRRRMTDSVRPLKCAVVCTAAQVTIFDDFFTTTLSGGASAFNMTHPRTGSTVEMRFVSIPKYRSMDINLWEISMDLEELP